ncbi:hypothetical protein HDU88_003547 [Geranomyces variabilis]|nr:hypothetical protein HDU88_003547 [Geranomyces variabilis]
MTDFTKWVDSLVQVVLIDGRVILGTLKGYDQQNNMILSHASERVFSGEEGVESVPLGLYIVRGEIVAVMGPIDQETDATIDWARVQAQPIPSMFAGIRF